MKKCRRCGDIMPKRNEPGFQHGAHLCPKCVSSSPKSAVDLAFFVVGKLTDCVADITGATAHFVGLRAEEMVEKFGKATVEAMVSNKGIRWLAARQKGKTK